MPEGCLRGEAPCVQAGLVFEMSLSDFGPFPVPFLGGLCVELCGLLTLGSGIFKCASFTHCPLWLAILLVPGCSFLSQLPE